ncbi:hypothetical protein HUA74_14155 [Myxococcus sp. CA051A]|uniref:DUF1302 domain-containing protein n=1 Tax=Myxococcus llanfairpwllgwyngyllgogerychwyrndrobwllllantysiliogogogochensis TaxID=2590453 RepID=A0A540WX44_9BACT|nr:MULTISPECIES: hypothetical protein [Myxococcus]NTX04046.1 hypothetical protein [Myxococcus sp. CA040A]NTX13342.1 hypothetical protein [Myxococcus sp. CA056]NTX35798.1 hypothetical protein [Myxococcus sp. CA033]NTX52682.1 hypothetical protein [Myxococcus sp. CA039A]NTX61802.1 hypothetical protein [Myxococcus sp. CA051A]
MKTLQKLALTGLISLSVPAWASDFVDTRLSFVFADDNVLAGSGETTPNSPNARFGAGNQNTQFYDNFNTRFSGFESLSNIVLYKRAPAFFEGLTTEAALTLLVLERPSGQVAIQDNSSYIRLNYQPPGWGEKEGISLVGFPVSADRFRLGYAYRISWGGSGVFTTRSATNGVPGAKLQITRDRWYAYVGGKTALVQNELVLEEETLYGVMAGAGVDILETLRVEAGGGYFQKGLVPGLATLGVEAPVNAAGVSAQVVYHVGVPVGTSVDFRLYKNDPEIYERFFAPEKYPGGLSYSVSLEGSYLSQTLEKPDQFGATEPQGATALALQARAKLGFLRLSLLGLYRSLSYIQFDVPGFPPFQDFPEGTELNPEIFLALGADYHLPALHFTPGFIFGIQRPASFRSPTSLLGGNNPPPNLVGTRTVVVRDVNQLSILPETCGGSGACGAEPIYSAKATFRWDLSDSVAAVGEVYYTYDTNRTTFRDDITGVAQATFEKPHALGFNTLLQARF